MGKPAVRPIGGFYRDRDRRGFIKHEYEKNFYGGYFCEGADVAEKVICFRSVS